MNKVLLDKDFSKKIINGINKEDGIINKCIFNESTLLNCHFKNCIFQNVDFRNAKLTGIVFEDCSFHAVNFSNSEMKYLDFKNKCQFTKTIFNAKLAENVTFSETVKKKTGLTMESIVANTSIEDQENSFRNVGFVREQEGSLSIEIKCNVYYDDEAGVWRATYYHNNDMDSAVTTDFTEKDLKNISNKIALDLKTAVFPKISSAMVSEGDTGNMGEETAMETTPGNPDENSDLPLKDEL